MYEDTVLTLELSFDELSLLNDLLNNYDYSSVAERQLVESLLYKLSEE
jgi:hypothetical protein